MKNLAKLLGMLAFTLGVGGCIAIVFGFFIGRHLQHGLDHVFYSATFAPLFVALAIFSEVIFFMDKERSSIQFFFRMLGATLGGIGFNAHFVFLQSFSMETRLGWVFIGFGLMLLSLLRIDFKKIRDEAFLQTLEPRQRQRLEAFEQEYIVEYRNRNCSCSNCTKNRFCP